MIKKIVIVGGGFAGWYTARSLQHCLPDVELMVIDSDKHPTIGVGEVLGFDAPINFSRLLGITNDQELMAETGAIYKFGVRGINFYKDHVAVKWGKFPNLKMSSLTNFYNGYDYPDFQEPWNHQPGDIGLFTAWLSMYSNTKTYDDMVIETSEQNHFLTNPVAPFNRYNKFVLREKQGFAYHIDAEKTSVFLRNLTLRNNDDQRVNWITSTVVDINWSDSNVLDHLILENGQHIHGDLFIDATGLQKLLMSASANNSWVYQGDEYCDAAWVCPSAYVDPTKQLIGASEFHGEDWGWRFLVRLYHRIGNGYIFNSKMVDPSVPLARLQEVVGDTQLVEPRLIRWDPGQYTEPWKGNLLPLGMSAAFVDPFDAPTFEGHSRALEDLIAIIKNHDNETNPQDRFNKLRDLTREERNLRLDLTFGMSRRSGPFWESRRAMATKNNYLEQIKAIVLEQRKDLESRLNWHWQHQYARTCMATDVDMSSWEFVEVTPENQQMADAFFSYNRARNQYIETQQWPNYSEWLQQNRFGGLTNQEVLAKLNPHLIKEKI
jgi:tryptophan halogenase